MPSLKSSLYFQLVRWSLGRFRKRNLPLPQARAERDRQSLRLFKVQPGVVAEACSIGSLPGQWLIPNPKSANGALLYLHGGAYVLGSILSHQGLASRLAAAAQAPCLIIDYRLAPESPFPAALDDAFAAYSHLLEENPQRPIAIAGDSAGGGLALALALRIRERSVQAPAALGLMSPWTDLTLSNPTHRSKATVDPYFPDTSFLNSSAQAYAGSHALSDPFLSPLFADLSNLPPTLIHVGEREALLDDSLLLGQRMVQSGVAAEVKQYPGMWHVWQAFGGKFREADASIAEMGMFMRRYLDGFGVHH